MINNQQNGTASNSLKPIEQRSILLINERGIIQYMNDQFSCASQYNEDELVGQPSDVIRLADQFGAPLTGVVNKGNTSCERRITFKTKKGKKRFMNVVIHLIYRESQSVQQMLICEKPKKRVEQSLSTSANLMQYVHAVIFVYSANEHGELSLSFVDGSIARALNLTKDAFSLKQLENHFCLEKLKHMEQLLRKSLHGERVQFELFFKGYHFAINLEPIVEGIRIKEVVGTATDITSRVAREQELRRLAHYDHLTNLPNRYYAKKKITTMIHSTKELSVGVIFIDLNHFKAINDSFGHLVGDDVLQQVAQKLTEAIDDSITITRYGGDEFLLIVPRATVEKVEKIVCHMKDKITHVELHALNESLPISFSVGSSFYPKHGMDFQTLVDHADKEMYKEKRACGTAKIEQNKLTTQSSLTKKLRKAVTMNTLRISYAPRVHAQTGALIGLQASVATITKSITPLPIETLPSLIQDERLTTMIGQWTLEQVCYEGARMEREKNKAIPISVGVTSAQLEHPLFVEIVRTLLQKTAYAPTSLTLELAPNVIDNEQSRAILHALKALNIQIHLTNFGEAPMSLQVLSTLPIDSFKLSPVVTREQATVHEKIISSIHLLAQGLGITISIEQSELLTQSDYGEGYYDEIILSQKDVQLSIEQDVCTKGYMV